MKQYRQNYVIRNTAKDRMEGRYGGAIRLFLLYYAISWLAQTMISSVGSRTMGSVYTMTGKADAATAVSVVFELLQLGAGVLLGVMNAGIALYFLTMVCGGQPIAKDLFYGFKNDSKKFLVVSAALTLCNTVCLEPGQYLSRHFLNTRDTRWVIPALVATLIGVCVYVPVSLGISLSFYLTLDFPQNSGGETLKLCWRLMKGNRKRLFLLELSFLPLILLCVLSFGIGFLWLEPYMQMCYTCFFLDLMNPMEA